ncbi:6-phosphofructokinase isozyme 2 [Corynebacterium occultum]|uniref:6-phosphofructokinase isozyme 2 n=1 Tax=Corynebacterium occultum TaxID=2675219 RepID=A0A6B8W285_9CORY|nr:1-phosphofructokinase family hexose kinase [Corynebacterium occultum]QGU07614.1 6-phosphofructokinase isozyme 2 [Corynebacterium occultum]
MILTFTPNPSIDRSLELSAPLQRGEVQRLVASRRAPGGKGINVAHSLHLAGHPTLAILPARADDPLLPLINRSGLPFSRVEIEELVRINTTVTEPDGTTTKLNGPGATLSARAQIELTEKLLNHSCQAQWLVMAGSLPPGVPVDWYSQLIRTVRSLRPELKIVVDTSEGPLREVVANVADAAPDLIKPNALELGQLLGTDGRHWEQQAEQGNLAPVIRAARQLNEQGIPEVLVTLGPAGALLLCPEGLWYATGPEMRPVSTVGAGDALLGGYLLGRVRGMSPEQCLGQAVAYGRAAVELPGTVMPSPGHLQPTRVTVTRLP